MGFKAGFSEVIITPETGLPMGGYGMRRGNATGVHDHLFARAAYFLFQEQESLLISADVLSFPLEVIKFYRKMIFLKTGIAPQRIFICALHNHSGPDTIGIKSYNRGLFRLKLVKKIFFDIGKKLIKLARQAKERCQEALVATGKRLLEKRLIINRREPLRDSKCDVKVLQFNNSEGQLIGLIVNYASHGTVLPSDNTLFTAEYPGFLVKRMKARLGQETQVLYLNGPCGDLNPNLFDFDVKLADLDAKKDILYDGPGHAKGDFKRARVIGSAIADLAMNISNNLSPEPVRTFKHISKSFILPLEDVIYEKTLSMYYKHFTYQLKLLLYKGLWCLTRTNIPYPLDFVKKDGKYYQEAEIHCLQLNDTAIAGIPGEVFSELGQRIETKSPFTETIIAELANGYVGYLYPLKDYKKGGYELFLSVNPAAGTYLTNKTILELKSLKK
jgi:neutral ceramidase